MASLRFLERFRVDSAKIPLRWLLVVPFVLQTAGATALVGYLSYAGGQREISNLANKLLGQTSERVNDRLDSYLKTPQLVVATNQLATQMGTLNLNNWEELRLQLWQQMLLNPSLPSNSYWSDTGSGIGYFRINSNAARILAEKVSGQVLPTNGIMFSDIQPNQRRYFLTDAAGNPVRLIYQFKDDFRTADWYQQAKRLGDAGWLPVSLARVIPLLQTLAVSPVKDMTGEVQGFFTASYFLSEISQFLNQLQFSPTGQVFILERSGDLVATSVKAEAAGTRQVKGKPDRLPVLASQDTRTREVAQKLLQEFGTFDHLQQPQQLKLKIRGQPQFVQVTPYQTKYGLDWLVVTVIPESDFMAEIHAQNRWTFLLSGFTLLVTISLGLLAARRITNPLHQLNLSARKIARNQFDHRIPNNGLGEVKQLGQSFQEMAEQLRLSFQLRTDYEQELKQQVAERTAELAQVKDLREAIFNESADAIFLVGPPPSTLILDCNQRAVEMFERESKDELIGIHGNQLQKNPFSPEQISAIGSEVEANGFWSQAIEYVTRSGRTFWANLAAKPICVAGQTMQLVRLTDISNLKQLELALQRSEAQTKDIINSAIAAIARMRFFQDGTWLVDQVSAGAERFSGYTPDELTQDSQLWMSRIQPDDLAVIGPLVFANIWAEETGTYEYRLQHKDGHWCWISQTNNSWWDETQQCWNVTVISVDITERKQVESALRRSEEQLRLLTDALPVFISYADTEQRYRLVNKTYETHFGLPREQICGRHTREIIGESNYNLSRPWIDRALAGESVAYDLAVPDSHQGNRYLSVILVPDRDAQSQVSGYYTLILDISDLKRTEELLRQSEARYLSILEDQTELITRFQPDGTLLFVNDAFCRYFGVSKEEVIGHNYRPNIHPDDQPAIDHCLALISPLHPVVTLECRVFVDDNLRWMQWVNRAIYDTDQNLLELQSVGRDINAQRQAEEALRVSEERLRIALEAAQMGIWDWNIVTNQIVWSESLERLMGLQPGTFDGRLETVQQMIYADDRALVLERISRSVEQGGDYDIEFRFVRPDGSIRWAASKGNVLRDQSGRPLRMLGVDVDISDRKQAELALQAKTEELNQFFSVTLDLLSIANTDGYFLRLNPQWEKTLGYQLEELEGSLFFDYVHPDDLDNTLAVVAKLAQQQEISNFVNRYRCKDGSYRWIEWRSYPLGNLIYSAARDITDRRQVELVLRQSEQKFKGAFDTITTGMALISLMGGFQEVNTTLCQMLGYTEAELLDMELEDLVYPADRQLDLSQLKSMMAGEIPGFQVEKRFSHKDGHQIWGLLNLALMRDTDGQLLYLIAQIADISDRHKLDEMKDEFISVVSHELRTPLTSIRGSLGMLGTDALNDEPETAHRMLQVALNSTNRLVRLVNDILDLERLKSGKAPLVMEACRVSDLMEQAVESVQAIAEQENIRLEWSPLNSMVQADPDAIVQALTNLLSNAIKFSQPGSTVWLKAECMNESEIFATSLGEAPTTRPIDVTCPHYILFSVIDQGRGIPPDKLESIFGRFQQVDSSDSRQKGGTGLGLAICKSIVKQHRGVIWAESTIGQGSQFCFTLPLVEPEIRET